MTTRDVIEEFFNRVAAGDPQGAAELLADKPDWFIPGSAALPWTGHRSTAAAVAESIGVLAAHVEPEGGERNIHRIVVEGEHAVVIGEFVQTARPTGRRFRTPVAMHFEVREHRITKMHMFEDTLTVSEAFKNL